MRHLVVSMLVLAAGCIRSELVECTDGRACPVEKVCDTVHRGCVDVGQLGACAGVAENAACTWDGGSGRCFGSVCLAPGCGNNVVEANEQCDDGNRTSGDGCNAECTSNETCGNGVVDVTEGEACDDGNLMSQDGCNSRCDLETPAWATVGIGPLVGATGHGAFDAHRGRFVHVSDGLTWEWDGTAWKLVATKGPPASASWHAVVYDTDRQVIVVIGASVSISGLKPVDVWWEWNGSTWTSRSATGTIAQAETGIATYDHAHQRLVVYGGSRMWALSTTTAMWTQLPLPSPNQQTAGGRTIGYDANRDRVVLVLGGVLPSSAPAITPITFELDDTSWTSSTAAFPGNLLGAPALVYDPDRQKLVGLGGANVALDANDTGILTYSPRLVSWSGTAWEDESASLAAGRRNLELAYDQAHHQLLAFGGQTGSLGAIELDELDVLTSTGWMPAGLATPHAAPLAFATMDTRRGHLVLVQGGGGRTETWVWDGAWQRALPPASPPLFDGAQLTYDPGRDAVLLVSPDEKTWSFDPTATTWTQLGTSGVVSPLGVVFDPPHHRVVAFAATGGFELASSGTEWTPISLAPPFFTAVSIAFDQREAVLVAMDTTQGKAYTFDGTTWASTLAPDGADYVVIADQRRGTIDFVSGQSSLWERARGEWSELGGSPLSVSGAPLYDPRTGRIVIIGTSGDSRVLVTRHLESATPSEVCTGTTDVDGDGRIGCADPDCWWMCTPACPPFTSCL